MDETTFFAFRNDETTPCLTMVQDGMDMAIEAFVEGRFGGIDEGEIDSPHNDLTTYTPSDEQRKDHRDPEGTTYYIAEACDFCRGCSVDYDAMTAEQRNAHACVGEYVTRTCTGVANRVIV